MLIQKGRVTLLDNIDLFHIRVLDLFQMFLMFYSCASMQLKASSYKMLPYCHYPGLFSDCYQSLFMHTCEGQLLGVVCETIYSSCSIVCVQIQEHVLKT